MKHDALYSITEFDGWVGWEAAEILAVGLGVPITIVQPQLWLTDIPEMVRSSLLASQGAHYSSADAELGLLLDHQPITPCHPLVIMHVLCGYDAAQSLTPANIQHFNHWVPLMFEADLDPLSIDLDLSWMEATAAVRLGPKHDVHVQMAALEGSSVELAQSCPDDTALLEAALAEVATSAPADDINELTGEQSSKLEETAHSPAYDVTEDFQHLLARTWTTSHECISEVQAVFEKHKVNLLQRKVKVSGTVQSNTIPCVQLLIWLTQSGHVLDDPLRAQRMAARAPVAERRSNWKRPSAQ